MLKKRDHKLTIDRIKAAVRYVAELRIPVYASQACFFLVLSVFPTLVLLLLLLRYTGLDVESLTGLVGMVIPGVVLPAAKRLILNAYNNTTGTLIPISILVALWSASRGMHGLLTGLNSVYRVSENRGYFYTRTVSVVYTLLFLVVLLLTLLFHVFDSTIMNFLAPLRWGVLGEVLNMRFFVLLFVQGALFTAMYMVLPNRRNRFWDSLPGAMLSAAGWLIFSDLYSLYVEHFSGYSNVYGSVYAVALCMLWLYVCVSILFYGGALNYYLTAKKREN